MSAPRIVVVVELERRVSDYLDTVSESEEPRLALDLARRDWAQEIVGALADLTERRERPS